MSIHPMAPVVVGLDGSAASFAALDLGAEEALSRVTPLEIVYVRPVDSTVDEQPSAGDARDALSTALGRVGADHPGLAVHGVYASGDPAQQLMAHMEGACLAVLGCKGQAGSETVGPVATEVASNAPVPVIVTRPFDRTHAGTRPRPVLVGVDGTPCGEDAVAFAFEEAALRGAPLEIHHVWWRPPTGLACCFPEAFFAGDTTATAAREQARRRVADAVASWSQKLPQVEVLPLVDGVGDGVDHLLAATHEAQLVVVGSHEHPGVATAMSAQVNQALLEGAGCSVAITQGS